MGNLTHSGEYDGDLLTSMDNILARANAPVPDDRLAEYLRDCGKRLDTYFAHCVANDIPFTGGSAISILCAREELTNLADALDAQAREREAA